MAWRVSISTSISLVLLLTEFHLEHRENNNSNSGSSTGLQKSFLLQEIRIAQRSILPAGWAFGPMAGWLTGWLTLHMAWWLGG